MKKNILSTLVALMCTVYMQAADELQIGELYYYLDTSTRTLEVVSFFKAGYSGDIVIPSSITYDETTYSVTSIGGSAFSLCTGLTSITIPNSVASIGEYAFYGCTGLTSVTIPNSVTEIGYSAFYNVPNIIYYGMATGSPWNARSMNGYVDGYLVYEDETKTKLLGCSSAATGEIVIPNSVMSIGEYAFYGCTGLTAITIPDSVTSIGEYAFYGCTGLTSITIPNSVTWIGDCAFSYCTGLTSITIPNSVTSIGFDAFYTVPNIVYYGTATGSPWGARSMNGYVDGYLVYEDETKTKLLACSTAATGEIVIPNSVTSIGESAFFLCTGLTSITIPNSVASIGEYAFYGCTGLTAITIPDSVTSIGEYAFYGCTGLTSITIPNSVTWIGDCAFSYCTGLTSITIPNSVTSIGFDAFYTVPNIVYYGTATGSPWGARSMNGYVDGYLVYEDETKTKLLGCSSAATGEIVIPNSVTSIGKFAFRGCTGLTSVTIPNSVTSIGWFAFESCTGLTSITSLAPIPPTTGKNAFGYVLTDIPVYVPCGSSDAYSMAEEWKSFTNYIEQLTAIVAITSQDENKGMVTITKQPSCEDNICTFVATPKENYRFIQWSDGNTDNPRTIIVTEDITLTAEFEDTSSTNVLQTTDNQFVIPQKIVRDGQVYILRNGKTYTTTGVEVK